MAVEEGKMSYPSILADFLKEKGLFCDQAVNDFVAYYEMTEETNKVMNLTAISSFEDYQTKHYIDSLLPFEEIQGAKTVCDVGSGAGFPAIPLAIINKDTQFTMVDSLNKRVNFLNSVIERLSLKNCIALHFRAEDFAKTNREKFDICTARAVAPLNILLEYTAPLVKVGGKVVAYKGSNAKEEIKSAENAAKILGCRFEKSLEFTLPGGEKREIIIYKKVRPCDKKYPRGGNKPRTNPIV